MKDIIALFLAIPYAFLFEWRNVPLSEWFSAKNPFLPMNLAGLAFFTLGGLLAVVLIRRQRRR